MTFRNQTSTQSKDEIRIFAPWAYYLFTLVLLRVAVLFVTVVGRDHNAPRLIVRCLMGVLAGTVLGCYAVLIGYINQDAGRRGMSRVLWTLIAITVRNAMPRSSRASASVPDAATVCSPRARTANAA